MTTDPRSRRSSMVWAPVAIGTASAIASSIILIWLNGALRHRHLANAYAGDMGQGFPASGLEGGGAAARRTLASWSQYAGLHEGTTGRSIAYLWLAVDAAFLATLGYGLIAAAVYRAARHPSGLAWLAARRGGIGHRLVLVGSALGLVLVAVDLIENLLATVVIATDGGGPAGFLRVWGRAKWVLAACALVFSLVGLVALVFTKSARSKANV